MTDAQILQIGEASIFSSYPDWDLVKVNSNYDKTEGPANPIAGKPIPTNKWFSPLFWWKNDLDYDTNPSATHNHSGLTAGSAIALRPMPAMYQVSPWGLMLTYRQNPEIKCGGEADQPPCGWPNSSNPMACSNWTNWRFDRDPNAIFSAMTISVDQLLVDKVTTPFFVKATDYGDWDVSLEWNDGDRQLQLTVLAGSPLLYGTASGGELEFQLPAADALHPISFYDGQGNSLGQAYMGANPGPNFATSTDGVIGMSFKTIHDDTDPTNTSETVYYAIYAPKGTTWNFTQGITDISKNPGRQGYLSTLKSTNLASSHQPIPFTVATLPPPPEGVAFPVKALQAFANAAGFQVTKTAFTWDAWDATSSTITAHYTFNVQNVASVLPSANPSVITSLFKPHQKLMANPSYVLNEAGEPYAYNSPRGPLKVIQLPVNATTATAQYAVSYPYYGYVPALPSPQLTSDDLTALTTYLSADSSQTSATTTDFLNDTQPDAYSSGTKLYYKLMQITFWLQQLQQIDTIPNWRNSTQSVKRTDAIQLLVDYLKAELQTFFSAKRPSTLAYQWHYFNSQPNDVYGFSQTTLPAGETLPPIFPCQGNADCNPDGDPLLLSLQTGSYWRLTQQDLINAQAAKKNPYIVLRGLDFTVNSFANTGPAVDMLMHLAWKQVNSTQTQNINMYAFFAPSVQAVAPTDLKSWKQCVWTQDQPQGAIDLHLTSNCGIGSFMAIEGAQTPWRVDSIDYNGSSTTAPNKIPADTYDIMLVFDCGADCTNFPSMCGGNPPSIPPNVSDSIWKGWELVLGPVHFQGKPYKFIAYNSVWNSLLGNVSWYGSTEDLSDHHFGWGYLIKAAALVAQFDTTVDPNTKKPWWDIEQGWGGIVNLLIRDVMDWHPLGYSDPNGLNFAHCKYLNPVEGHMYANGNGNGGDGNDEESSSEAVNFANACIEWGTVTGQEQIRDLGILLRSMYAQAVPLYWFNVDGDVLPSTTAAQPFPIAGQITGAGNRHDTYFSGGDDDWGCLSRNSDVVAIQTLPVNAGTLRLTLLTPQLKVAWETVTQSGGPFCGAKAKCYLSTLLSFQALFAPETAKASFLQEANPQQPFKTWYNYLNSSGGLKQPEDHSYATTFAFICSLTQLGAAKAACVASPDLNPFYMPMADGSVLVYNYKSTSQTFRIGNTSVTVPPQCCLKAALT